MARKRTGQTVQSSQGSDEGWGDWTTPAPVQETVKQAQTQTRTVDSTNGSSKFDRGAQSSKRAQLPEVLHLGDKMSEGDRSLAADLLVEALELKLQLDVKTVGQDGKPVTEFGIRTARLEEIKQHLTMIQVAANQEGLRHGQIVFVAQLRDGKRTIDRKKQYQYLVERGVSLQLLQESEKHAESFGDSFWNRDLESLER